MELHSRMGIIKTLKRHSLSKTKVLVVGPINAPEGGVAVYVQDMLSSNLNEKYELRLLNTKLWNLSKKYFLIRIIQSVYFILSSIWFNFNVTVKIVHIHSSSHNSFWEKSLIGMISFMFRKKVVLHLHGARFNSFLFDLNKFNKKLAIWFLNRVDKIIALSNSSKTFLKKQGIIADIVVIPNAIFQNRFPRMKNRRRQNRPLKLLFIGSIGERKGLYVFADALAILRERSIDFHLDLLGVEEFKNDFLNVKEYYQHKKLDEKISFRGLVTGDKKNEFLRNADIFILPSNKESFGIANLEAMASGLPIISTKVGAIPEYIDVGKNGFLIEPGDFQGLANYIIKLINDSDMRYQFGQNNIQKIETEFDWDIVSQKLENIYTGLLHP